MTPSTPGAKQERAKLPKILGKTLLGVPLKVLLIGKGGREHAIAWKISKSSNLSKLFLWPGNPAMGSLGQQVDIAKSSSHRDLALWAKKEGIDLVISGPEAPLSEGLADDMLAEGIPIFGPKKAGAMLESSKVFAKEVMQAAGIPTAASQFVTSETQCRSVALTMLQNSGGAVLKASGLAAGKGVFVCTKASEVEDGLKHLYHSDLRLAAEKVVVEEVLHGRECSYFTFIGSSASRGLGFAVDYKRLKDGDEGPNTGGMGSYTPVEWLPADAARQVEQHVVAPLLKELQKRDIPYTGCLYVGLMWHPQKGPQVVEFNVRLGDPEAQILAVYDDRDWLTMMAISAGVKVAAAAANAVDRPVLHKDRVIGVVLTSDSYPFGTDAGKLGTIPANLFANTDVDGPCLFAASITSSTAHEFKSSTGRVVSVVARANTFNDARHLAYRKVEVVRKTWPGCHFRTDIGLNAEVGL